MIALSIPSRVYMSYNILTLGCKWFIIPGLVNVWVLVYFCKVQCIGWCSSRVLHPSLNVVVVLLVKMGYV